MFGYKLFILVASMSKNFKTSAISIGNDNDIRMRLFPKDKRDLTYIWINAF